MKEKTCPRCGQTKPISEFYIFKDGRVYTYCRDCDRARQRVGIKEETKLYRMNVSLSNNRESALKYGEGCHLNTRCFNCPLPVWRCHGGKGRGITDTIITDKELGDLFVEESVLY